jgi:hypothetical protein
MQHHYSSLADSGLSFGRDRIVGRIYDKTREIREVSADKKWLYYPWAAAGWVGTETVWRVEIQIRHKALDEFTDAPPDAEKKKRKKKSIAELAKELAPDELLGEKIRRKLRLSELSGLRESLASLWGYAVGGAHGHSAWLKWCTPHRTDTRRSRWDPRPEWKLIQEAPWHRFEAFPVTRQQIRDAKFQQLTPQAAGLDKALAALAGPVSESDPTLYDAKERKLREPTPADFERHKMAYVHSRSKGYGPSHANERETWERAVNESRVERAIEHRRALRTAEVEREELRKDRERRRERQSRTLVAMAI